MMTGRLPHTVSVLVFALLVSLEPAAAQERVTIRDINALAAGNLRNLQFAGADLTESDIRELVESPFEGDTVIVDAVLMSNPRNSGSAEVVDGRVARVHFFIRDVAADTLGVDGMGIQVVDDRWDANGVLDLRVGDVVRIRAVVSEFQGAVALRPRWIVRLGWHEDLGLGFDILAAKRGLQASELNREVAPGRYQAAWSALPNLHGSPACLEEARVTRVFSGAVAGRADWAVTTTGGSRVYVFDTSHRFRSDTRSAYPATFNLRSDDFEPPPVGAVVKLCGFVVLQAFNDPDGISLPPTSGTGSMLSMAPFEDHDVSLLSSPPVVSRLTRPDYVHGPRAAFLVDTEIEYDPSRPIRRVRLTSVVGTDTTRNGMYQRSPTIWTQSIPAARQDGAVVRYRVDVFDAVGAVISSPELQYRVLEEGITSIRDIQETHDGHPGPSPFSGLRVPMDVVAHISALPDSSGRILVQDDTLLRSWSGIEIVDAPGAPGLTLGQQVRITSATIEEVDGNTRLVRPELAPLVGETIDVRHRVIPSSDLTRRDNAEAFEGMLLRISPATVIHDWGAGEWSVSNRSLGDTIRVISRSPLVASDALSVWESRPFIQGIWMQERDRWMLVLESPTDFGEVVNVGIDEGSGLPPGSPLAVTAYPNPFRGSTRLRFSLPTAGRTRVELFDVRGRSVAVILDGVLPAGPHETTFSEAGLPAGVYVVRIGSESGVSVVPVVHLD